MARQTYEVKVIQATRRAGVNFQIWSFLLPKLLDFASDIVRDLGHEY